MRFYKNTHAFYAGVDLHARSMFLLGLHVARRGFWGAKFPIPPEGGSETMPSLHGNVQRPDPVELFGAASVFSPISEMP